MATVTTGGSAPAGQTDLSERLESRRNPLPLDDEHVPFDDVLEAPAGLRHSRVDIPESPHGLGLEIPLADKFAF
jgi:hypothetical protein